MKNKNALYKLICILICVLFAFAPVAISFDAKANSGKKAGAALASSEDEEEVLLYSFGLLSDLHIQYETGTEDFKRALIYLRDKVPFTCICGDLVSYATAENMAEYREYVDAYSGDMPLFECSGNHDTYDFVNGEVKAGTLTGKLLERWIDATGKENPNYSFECGEDVFIFLSMKSDNPDDLFEEEGLRWFAQTLEKNKNKRCFVFQHVQDPEDKTADPSRSYSDILNGISGREFLRLIKKYKNTVWFHGHTHLTFQGDYSPINEDLGYRSVHIPSLSSLRFYDEKLNALENFYFDEHNNKVWGALLSEGYIVDVYRNKIVLKGINFAAGANQNQVELLEDKVFGLDTSFIYTEDYETTSASVTEATEGVSSLRVTSSCVTDSAEAETTAILPTTIFTDPTELKPTLATDTETVTVTETDRLTLPADTSSCGASASDSQMIPETQCAILGDSNGDGRVNIRDATFIRKVAARIFELGEVGTKCADVNTDGSINIKDATLIQKYSANLETGRPIGLPV